MGCGAIFFPPDVTISSFLRSVIFKNPSSSISPMSPVMKNPSSVKTSSVFAGCLKYPLSMLKIWGPFARTSPSSAILIWVSLQGRPTNPGLIMNRGAIFFETTIILSAPVNVLNGLLPLPCITTSVSTSQSMAFLYIHLSGRGSLNTGALEEMADVVSVRPYPSVMVMFMLRKNLVISLERAAPPLPATTSRSNPTICLIL